MTRVFTYQITTSYDSMYALLQENHYPRSIVSALRSGTQEYTVNDAHPLLWEPLAPGDLVTVTLRDEESSHMKAADLPLHIIYEDQDILVVNKPAGMPSHPSMKHQEDTLANACMYYYGKQNIPFVYRIANRLDIDTSGLVVISKNALAAAHFEEMILSRNLHREYRCIVEGNVLEDEEISRLPWVTVAGDSGVITAPIAREEGSILRRRVDAVHGQSALTAYRILGEHNGMTLLAVKLGTGRTHQIRVHMNYIGHPLPGDYLYHPVYDRIARQPLHSCRLAFSHPITGAPMEFTCGIPDDMKLLLS